MARLGLAKVLVQKQEYEEAENELEKLISDQPRSPVLERFISKIYSRFIPRKITRKLRNSLAGPQKIPETSGPDRPAYALYYLIRLQLQQGLITEAVETAASLVERFPDHPITVEACLILSRQQTRIRAFRRCHQATRESACSAPPTFRQRTGFASTTSSAKATTGEAMCPQQETFFLAFPRHSITIGKTLFSTGRSAVFNSADASGFEQAFRELEQTQPHSDLIGDLLFDKGLLQAKSGNASADETFRMLLQKFPNHPQAAQARLVQTEIRMTEQPPDLNGAREALREVSSGTSDPDLEERADRLKFFAVAADPSQNVRSVQALAQDYLEKYQDSPSKAEVRLKLGELYFKENDFPNAQTQFELVREESPDSPLVESALFLAGEAARKSLNSASVDRAISLFEDVYKLGGPLKFQARLEQATTMRQTKQEREAIVLLDDLLTQNPPADIRYQALDGKGEAQFTLAANEPKMYEASDQNIRYAHL